MSRISWLRGSQNLPWDRKIVHGIVNRMSRIFWLRGSQNRSWDRKIVHGIFNRMSRNNWLTGTQNLPRDRKIVHGPNAPSACQRSICLSTNDPSACQRSIRLSTNGPSAYHVESNRMSRTIGWIGTPKIFQQKYAHLFRVRKHATRYDGSHHLVCVCCVTRDGGILFVFFFACRRLID